MPVERGRGLAGAVEPSRQRLVERVDEQRRLAAAGDAGDAGEEAERDLDGDVLQVIAARADEPQHAGRVARPPLGHRDLAHAGEILAGERVRVGHHVGWRALGDDHAAMHAGAGADIDHVIGGADRVLVVLDHDHRVAEVAQPLQRLQEPGIVALMQADRGLVEHVEDAGEAGADLRGEPDALALAAGERAGGAREREIFEADIDQEFQPRADLLEDAPGDLVLLGGEKRRQLGEPARRGLDRHLRDFADMRAADLHAQRLGLEPIAVAGRARHVGEIAGDLLARPVAVGLAEAPLEIGDHAFERPLGVIGAHAVVVGEADVGLARAVEDRLLRLLRQILPFGVEGELVVLAEREQRLHVIGRARLRPRRDRALAQRALLVGDDQVGVDVLLDAEPAAFRAGAERVVEREQPRLDLGNGEAGDRAGEFLREHQPVGVGRRRGRELGRPLCSPSPAGGGSDRLCRSGAGSVSSSAPHPNASRSTSPCRGR